MSINNLTSSLKTPCNLFLLKSVVVLFWSVWIRVAWYRSRCRCWLYPFLPWCWWTRCPSLQFARILGFWSDASFECSNDASAVRGNVARFSWIFFQERLMFEKLSDLFLCFCSDLSVRICVVGSFKLALVKSTTWEVNFRFCTQRLLTPPTWMVFVGRAASWGVLLDVVSWVKYGASHALIGCPFLIF